MSRNGLRLSILLFVIAFVLDRAHKYVQLEMFGWRGGELVPVTGFFDYVLYWNTGVSYGLFNSFPVWAIGILVTVAMAALAVWWWRSSSALVRSGLALCLGGALSNALDRVLYGAVADFFHFHWQEWSFYVFNIADVMITLGVGLLVLDILGIGRGKAPAAEA